MENHKNYIDNSLLSQRAKNILNKALSTDQANYDVHIVDEKLESCEVFLSFKDNRIDRFSLRLNDSIHQIDEKQLEQAAIFMASLDILQKAGMGHILELSFREVESFMRDDGSLKAWDSVSDHQKFYRESLNCLVSVVTSTLLMKAGASLVFFDDLNLKEKLAEASKICLKISIVLNILSLDDAELVNIEENEIIISFPEKLIKSKYFDAMLESCAEYFHFCFATTGIKLVAQ